MKKKLLYRAEVSLPDPENAFLRRFDLLDEMPVKLDYRYAYSERQARFLFEKIYPPDNIIRITREVKSESSS